MDSEGKTYCLDNLDLPGARRYGEPLSSRLNLFDQIKIISMFSSEPESKFIFASDSGYGFISEISNAFSKNKKGKNFLSLPKNSYPLHPVKIENMENQLIAAITLEGRLLIFEAKELPELGKGKGNQIIRIPKKDFENNKDKLIIIHLMEKDCGLVIHSGKRILNITLNMIEDFKGKRGNRGKILPRGFRKVQKLENKE
jgi:topoisomerase-4 subunit A